MGFRIRNLNPIYRSYILSTLSSAHHRHHSRNPSAAASSLLEPLTPPHFHIPRRWHLGHSHSHDHRHDTSQQGESIFRLGLAADIGLATGKALTGYLSGSTAIIADAAHSVSDVVLSGVALLSYRAGMVPKDKEHPYGHGKFESLGALGISFMLLTTAGGIAWHAIDILLGLLSTSPEVVAHSLPHDHAHNHGGGHHHGIDMEHPTLALTMTVVSISVKEGLYWITKRAGEKQGSGLMKANAWHHRADAISSVVALIGVGGAIVGVKFLDPLAGLVVSGMIFKAGLETGYQSVLELVDAAIPADQLQPIVQTILRVEGVKGCHRVRGRRAGSYLYLDVHIVVDPFLSVSSAHEVGENVRQEIHKSHPEIAEVFIHIDPAYLQCPPDMLNRREKLDQRETKNRNMEDKDIESIVSKVFSSEFLQEVAVERITRHLSRGKTLLQIEVSLPPEVLIGDAMKVAAEAEQEIVKAIPDVIQVSFHPRLGRPIPKFDRD